jgi:hypothetical protein
MNVKVEIKLSLGARKIGNATVDHFEYHSEPIVPPRPAGAALAKLGSYSGEMIAFGPYVVYAINQPAAALDSLIAQLQAGKGQGAPLRATRDLGTGGFVYCDIEVAHGLGALKDLLPADLGGKIPTMTGNYAPLTFAGFDFGQTRVYRSRLPIDLVRGLALPR